MLQNKVLAKTVEDDEIFIAHKKVSFVNSTKFFSFSWCYKWNENLITILFEKKHLKAEFRFRRFRACCQGDQMSLRESAQLICQWKLHTFFSVKKAAKKQYN
jgi:hypothetical protein